MASRLNFKVRSLEPVLVAPAKPTPHEFKRLSDIDDQEGLRFQIPAIQFYRNDPFVAGRDPAKVLREATANALVFYYPLAGRLREEAGRKLIVECTGEGVLFIEADADVRLEQFGDALQPPFPYLEELLHDVEGSGDVLHCPLLLIQVTRLRCGGFILAGRYNHVMWDWLGMLQFMCAVAELARGLPAPTVSPVWNREILEARNPPSPSFVHREYDQVLDTKGTIIPLDHLAHRSFLFGPTEIASLRKRVPPHLCKSSTFEVLTAFLWKCRTVALSLDPEEEVRITFSVNARGKHWTRIPRGYYGNAFACPAAVSTAGELCGKPLGYALELVKKAKGEVNEEFLRSVADLMVSRGRPHFTVVRSFLVSDLTKVGFGDLDFGWGKAVYGGLANTGVGVIPGVISFYTPSKDGIVVPIYLPPPAMDKFAAEIEGWIKEPAATSTYPTSAP